MEKEWNLFGCHRSIGQKSNPVGAFWSSKPFKYLTEMCVCVSQCVCVCWLRVCVFVVELSGPGFGDWVSWRLDSVVSVASRSSCRSLSATLLIGWLLPPPLFSFSFFFFSGLGLLASLFTGKLLRSPNKESERERDRCCTYQFWFLPGCNCCSSAPVL